MAVFQSSKTTELEVEAWARAKDRAQAAGALNS